MCRPFFLSYHPPSLGAQLRVSQPRLRPQLRKTLQMATEQEDSIRLIRRALVLRAKYRVQEEKERVPMSMLGLTRLIAQGFTRW